MPPSTCCCRPPDERTREQRALDNLIDMENKTIRMIRRRRKREKRCQDCGHPDPTGSDHGPTYRDATGGLVLHPCPDPDCACGEIDR